MSIKSVKSEQLKLLIVICGGLLGIALLFLALRNDNQSENSGIERYYEKSISTGIDDLSDKELWIEKSTNELAALKKQNEDLQEQLDKVQKVVVGIGKSMNIFDGNEASRENNSIENTKDFSESPTTEEPEKMDASFGGMQNFIKNSNKEIQRTQEIPETHESKPEYDKLRKSKIKTISFSNADNEYDLDENFIFAATYARCVLVGSVTVSAGVGASSNPQPVLLRLTDPGNLPNNVKGFMQNAVVIGAAYGELSSESVVIRLERIVKIDKNGKIGLDIPVKGYVAGENGDSRIRGIVIDRAGAVVRQAAIGGFFSGIADFLTRNSNSGVTFEPNSGLAQFSPQKGARMLEQGASKGIGNAVEKYADFYIKRAEQLQPVIQIDGGRKLTIVFTESVKASSVNLKKVRKSLIVSKWHKHKRRRK